MVDAPYTGADVREDSSPTTVGAAFGSNVVMGLHTAERLTPADLDRSVFVRDPLRGRSALPLRHAARRGGTDAQIESESDIG